MESLGRTLSVHPRQDGRGRTVTNVSEADALNYVAGYCTAHDFSARDLQLETPSVQWMVGKTLDNFGPIGPYFVSADVVGDPNNLKIETYVNGERRQSSNTSFMIFNPQKVSVCPRPSCGGREFFSADVMEAVASACSLHR